MQKGELLYSGKAKSVYVTDEVSHLILNFRNDTSAFDGKKKESLENKGATNNAFNAFIMEKLEKEGIKTHFVQLLNENESLVKRLSMFPIECVVRNFTAGSLCRRLGIEEGKHLESPLFEFFLKNDELGDPMINDHHIIAFGWANQAQLEEMRRLSFAVNKILVPLFSDVGLLLVDFKLEFGLFEGEMRLGDEFTPDGCRLWDKETGKKLDKDRFRQSLGDVVESYQEVGKRLGIKF